MKSMLCVMVILLSLFMMLFMIYRSEEHTSELQSRVDISYAVFCLKTLTCPEAYSQNRRVMDRTGFAVCGNNTLHCADFNRSHAEHLLQVKSVQNLEIFFFKDPVTPDISLFPTTEASVS